jgi:N-methyl-L-proline demethylase
MRANDPLLQPFQLRHLTLPNRILSTSHEPAYSEDGMPKERYRRYHLEKAKGGLALTMIGGSAVVAEDSPAAFGNLLIYKDEIVPWLRDLADACHEHGTAVMCQITHLGRRTNWNKADWLPVLAPSPIREPAHRAFPKEAEDWDLERILKGYADAAQRCRAAGLDGVEIEAYGHLADQFWSPATNRRDDQFGGTLDNRMRFSLAVVDAVRDAVGPDYIVGIRNVADESWDEGLTRGEGMAIGRRLAETGKLDFLNVIRGHIHTDEGLSHVIPSMGTRSAPHLEFAAEVRRKTGVPVFHSARIADVATARHAVADDLVDMVGMTRALIADPHIAVKVAEGREDEIRPCVGAGYCIDRIYEGGETLCIHNPASGREETVPHHVPKAEGPPRKVVVVGAGPAGLEAARVSAERGHDVVLFEAAPEAGGQILLASRHERRREIVGIVHWRVARCQALGVDMRFNVYAEAADVLALDPDVVIVATGGLPNLEFVGTGADLVVSSWDILSGAVAPGESVLVFDDNGTHPGMMAAEIIAKSGAALEIATPERGLAIDIGGTNYPAYFKSFAESGARITLNSRLTGVRRQGDRLAATLFNEYATSAEERMVEQVVVEHGTLPLDDVYFALKDGATNRGAVDYGALIVGHPQDLAPNADGGYQLFRIGDAVSSRNVHAAIYDALRLCCVL